MKWMAVWVLLIGVQLVVAIDDNDTQEHWETFKEMYNKTYDNPGEEEIARDNFEDNLLDAALHNLEDVHDYDKGVNEYSDMPPEEQVKALCKTELPGNITERVLKDFSMSERAAPESVDWRQNGYVSKVRNQGRCGACWAFAAAQAIECQINKKWRYGSWECVLSIQQLIDCSGDYGNGGCQGGWPQEAYSYVQKNGKGIIEEYNYPYKQREGTCSIKEQCNHFKIQGFAEVGPAGDEEALRNSVAENGCHSAAIYVSKDFMGYRGGIYFDPTYRDQGVNHGVVICGYGTENGVDYWIIKNSWGSSWGENGYMKLARNKGNHLDIATYAAYPYEPYI